MLYWDSRQDSMNTNQKKNNPQPSIIAPIHWEIMHDIIRSQREPTPPKCSSEKIPSTFPSLRSWHPRTQRTIKVVSKNFGWPSLSNDVTWHLNLAMYMPSPKHSDTRMLLKDLQLSPASKLPTAIETAEVIFTEVFWHYSIPKLYQLRECNSLLKYGKLSVDTELSI